MFILYKKLVLSIFPIRFCFFVEFCFLLSYNRFATDGFWPISETDTGRRCYMAYESVYLEKELQIDRIYTIHYFEYRNDFYYAGERHNFWEFQCVDKGKAEVCAEDEHYVLNRGQVIFHKPNEFHNLSATGTNAPNIIVVSFACNSPCMSFFENKLLEFSDTERSILGLIIAEARHCFSSPLDNPYTEKMEKRPDILFGSQQLLISYLEQLLIHMLRRYTTTPRYPSSSLEDAGPVSSASRKIVSYFEEHIRDSITIEDVCHDNLIGRSQLQKLFREEYGYGVIEFFSHMKINFARQLIRENDMNFTQISEFLGYSSIHYFSRQFKKICGMTPTEYASSIKAISERPQDTDPRNNKEDKNGADA